MQQAQGNTTTFSKQLKVSFEQISSICDPLECLRTLIYQSAWSLESPAQTQVLTLSLEFARTQFTLLNKRDADERTTDFIARLCGAFTLGDALGDADVLNGQLGRIELWLEGSVHGSKRV